MIMGTRAGSARTPSGIIDYKHHTLFVFFLILYTHWGLLRYVWKCWNWCLCTTWVLHTRLLTNAKKATVSVLYWYTSFPSSSWAQNFWKHKVLPLMRKKLLLCMYVCFFIDVIIAGQSAGAFFRLRTGNPVSVNISRKFFFRGEKIFLPI